MRVQWRNGCRRALIVLSALWLVFSAWVTIAEGYRNSVAEKGWWEDLPLADALTPEPQQSTAYDWMSELLQNIEFILLPVLCVWIVFFATTWILSGFIPKK